MSHLKRTLSSNDKDEPKPKDGKFNEEENLLNNMNNYIHHVEVTEEENEKYYEDLTHDLKKQLGEGSINFSRESFKLISTPTDQFIKYQIFLKHFGYTVDEKNFNYLRNNGIYNVLKLEKPIFSFWQTGLWIYPMKMEMVDVTKYPRFVFRTNYCSKHEYDCNEKKNECIYEDIYTKGDSFSFLFSGVFRAREINKKFWSYHVELNYSEKIEKKGYNIMNTLTIKNTPENIYKFDATCSHNDCITNNAPLIEGMPKIYKVCSKITKTVKFDGTLNNKKCFVYGSSIQGQFHKQTNTFYLSTYHVTDIFFV